MGHGLEVCSGALGQRLKFRVVRKSSAARAAHRELRSLLRLFLANHAWGFARERLSAHLDIASCKQGGRARLS